MTDSELSEIKQRVYKAQKLKEQIEVNTRILNYAKECSKKGTDVNPTILLSRSEFARERREISGDLARDIVEYIICSVEMKIADLQRQYDSL